jgi:mono/diheme cytochrome c family protein
LANGEAQLTEEAAPFADKRSDPITGCGFGLFVLFIAQIVIGLILELRYKAVASSAYQDVHAIQTGGLAIVRGLHYWGSAVLILGSFALLGWMVQKGRFVDRDARTWISIVLLSIASFLSQVTGNLLPFDRHGVQTAVVEGGVASQMPVAGRMSANLIFGGEKFNEGTIQRWHLGHIGFVVVGLLAIWLFWSANRNQQRNRLIVWTPFGIAALMALMVAAPLGMQAGAIDYGSYDAQVSWYTWPLHGSLNLFSRLSPDLGWIGSGVFPPLFLCVLLGAPAIGKRFSPKFVQIGFMGFCVYFAAAAALFGGKFAPVVGNRDPGAGGGGVVTQPKGAVNQQLYDQGRTLFNSAGCVTCHGQDGRNGTTGPTLLDVAKRRGSDPDWYMKFIHEPTKVKPTSMMPPFPGLKDNQTRAIAEFLIYQK